VTLNLQIEALESLAALDAELRELTDQLTQEQKTLSDKRTQAQALEERLSRGKQSSDEMDRSRGDLIGELRQMGIQVERSREKLSRCRTEREANAAQREVEELRKLYRDREIELEKLDALIQQARGELSEVEKQRESVSGDLGATETVAQSSVDDVSARLTTKKAERDTYVRKIKPEVYRRYELVRKRRGTAIASTTDGTCSACHIRLQPMLFQQLMRADEFGQCPSCNRILYFRPGPSAEAGTQSGSP
jgi:predicted  nucleic acid-binding Zn-ribbon protein